MSTIKFIARGSVLVSLITALAGCVIAPDHGPREGYYDRPHHRYYHDHGWHDCRDRDDHHDRDDYCH